MTSMEGEAGTMKSVATGGARACPHLILLHETDNVLVCAANVAAGDQLMIDGECHSAPEDVGLGHKIARYPIAPGDKVIKYGAPIGSAVQAIAAGGWVHVHNVTSDYLPSHSRETVREDPR
jgi:D-threo-aldose 1-dehydrogenase